MNNTRDQIAERMRSFPYQKYKVRLCVLFGSHASGTASADSDIDLAFFLEDSYSKLVKLDLLTEAAGILASDKVDMVIINDTLEKNPLVVSRALTEGVTLFEAVPGIRIDLHLRARKSAEDARHLLRIADAAKRGKLNGK